MNSEGFCLELFTQSENYEETPLRDRKAWIELWNRKGKAEFLRDFIALANTARCFGKPAYLLLGINDKGEIVGIDQMIERLRWNGLDDHQIAEKIRNQVSNLIREYITPSHPHWEFKFCRTEEKKALGYFLIGPITNGPFRVKKAFGYDEGSLQPGQCWIRMGESKHEVTLREISPEQEPYCYSYAQVPYLLPRHWRDYMKGGINELNVSPNIEQRYIELQADTGSFLEEEVSKFLNDPNMRWLIIEGVAGSGKTLFLKRWISKQAENNLVAIDEIIHREEFVPPPDWIPVYFRLGQRGPITNLKKLTEQLLNNINSKGRFWETRPSEPEQLFEYKNLKWLFCLDGLDEICDTKNIGQFINALREFSERFPKVKVILTTRPGFTGLPDGTIPSKLIRIERLRREQIENYIGKCLSTSSIDLQPEDVDELVQYLFSDKDLAELCALPIYLEAAVEELLSVRVPPLEVNEPATTEASEPIRAESEEILSGKVGDKEQNGSLSSIQAHLDVTHEDMILESEDYIPRNEEPSSIGPEKDDDIERDYLSYTLPRRAVLIDKVYQRLWNREINRQVGKEREFKGYFTKVGKLALKMDGNIETLSQEEAKKYIERRGLEWVLNMGGVLLQTKSGWIKFYNRLAKIYFAASFIKPHVENGTCSDIGPLICKCQPEFRSSVHEFLAELTAQELEPIFSC